MWRHLIVFNLMLALSAASIADLTDICRNIRIGDVVSHPFDCQAYFICDNVPIIQYCDAGLHFDAEHKVCNWPEHAKCKVFSNGGNGDEVIQTDVETETETDTDIKHQGIIKHVKPSFMAYDVESGVQTDPMNKYDPQHVECRHFGAYFLPHPQSCRRYYLCAYGYKHQHKCGHGTAWNYKRQECEIDDEAECYSRTVAGVNIDTIEEFQDDWDKNPTEATYNSPTTICYVVDVTGTTGTTWNPTGTTWTPTGTGWTPTGTSWNPTGTTWNPTGTTWNPTGTTWTPTGTTWYPTGTYHTATTNPQPSTTPRSDTSTKDLKCPDAGEAYLPNADDCSKYFICVGGRAIPTTCPQGLYWDQNAEFCDLAKNVHCYQNL